MIVLTGAGGFVGSVVLGYLNKQGITDVVLVDDLPFDNQFKNLIGKHYLSLHSTEDIFDTIKNVDTVIHVGANSSTLEKNWKSLYNTNVVSTRKWNAYCQQNNIPFIFTSSAAVYGNGNGPLNHYAFSKLSSENEITGVILRLFNVYGPNEYHKDRMASTIFHWYNQLASSNEIKIFEHSSQYFRDFVYVEDVARIIYFFLTQYKPGIYDIGSGVSESFTDIADYTITHFGKGNKNVIPMPQDLQLQYQKNTRADLSKLSSSGFDINTLTTAYTGVEKYIEFLKTNSYY